jgi:hypothetical protein
MDLVDEVQVDHGPYAGMTDEQVLARACDACKKASTLPPGSIERAIQWAVFDGAMAELDQRAFRHILGKLKDAG